MTTSEQIAADLTRLHQAVPTSLVPNSAAIEGGQGSTGVKIKGKSNRRDQGNRIR